MDTEKSVDSRYKRLKTAVTSGDVLLLTPEKKQGATSFCALSQELPELPASVIPVCVAIVIVQVTAIVPYIVAIALHGVPVAAITITRQLVVVMIQVTLIVMYVAIFAP